jgi:hypothetical protein
MPWLIQHKCNPSDPEPSEYGIMRGERSGLPLTRIMCPNSGCREEFFIVGHEMFTEAEQVNQGGQPVGLPPGFLIARSRRGG